MKLVKELFSLYNVGIMYIRTVSSRKTEYVQLAHNHRDPNTGHSKARVLYNFGRKDQVDVESLRRLVGSIARFLGSENLQGMEDCIPMDWPLEFVGSRQLGGPWLLQGLWERLGIGNVLRQLLKDSRRELPMERMLFALVASRVLAPSSKLHMEHWVAEEAFIPGLPEVDVHYLYRTMDFLLEAQDAIQNKVFFSIANLLNLEVDLLFLDTTSTYFEIESEDDDVPGSEEDSAVIGLRKRNKHSKDKRPDLPQVVIAFAVTRTGIPVRCWVWPGNTSDQTIMKEVKADLNRWKLGQVVMVQDAGFNSEANRRILQSAGGHYIIGEKLRHGSKSEPAEPLTKRGRYTVLPSGLEIKDVIVNADSAARRRFILVRNPDEAKRDYLKREDIVENTERQLEKLTQLEGEPHKKAACELRAHPVYGFYLRQTKTGKLKLDRAKIRTQAQYDGKYLISTSDFALAAEDVVKGYKQLFEIERVFRDMKHLIDIRPVYHRLPDRIRAHVLLCWLGMLLIRVAEDETAQTWFQLKKSLATLQLGIHKTRAGEVWQTGSLRPELKQVMKKLKVEPPPKFFDFPTPTRD